VAISSVPSAPILLRRSDRDMSALEFLIND
jgi:hypothetical protein